uniref:Uncharacterized protein n=1 Tax=Bubo bubo TaxID=30461 RepID=A0A8C0ECY8_BUBBB
MVLGGPSKTSPQTATAKKPILAIFLFYRVFKKSSPNCKLTVYLGKRDFVDHLDRVDPVGE